MSSDPYTAGISLGRIVDLIEEARAANLPEYGKPGRRCDTLAEQRTLFTTPVSDATLCLAHDIATLLDLDDAGMGDDLQIRKVVTGDGTPLPQGEAVVVAPAAYLRVARRSGLFRPGRSFVSKATAQADWTATATAYIRSSLTASDWTEVGVQVLYHNVYERDTDGSEPVESWEIDPFSCLLTAAECHVAHKALAPLLNEVPCSFAGAHLHEDKFVRASLARK